MTTLFDTEKEELLRGRLITAEDGCRYITGGNATFTLRSLATDSRFTYKVTKVKNTTEEPKFFVGVMKGPDTERDFYYMGLIDCIGFRHTNKSRVSRGAECVKAFDWFWKRISAGHMPSNIELWHEGRCGRCGRKLTVPESIAKGLGPECAQKES